MKKHLIINLIIGFCIILSPIIIGGRLYDINNLEGYGFFIEIILRNGSFIIGLLVIYDSFKNYFKNLNK